MPVANLRNTHKAPWGDELTAQKDAGMRLAARRPLLNFVFEESAKSLDVTYACAFTSRGQ